jgi:DNA repair exonuclease SbcCD ATPase subunit
MSKAPNLSATTSKSPTPISSSATSASAPIEATTDQPLSPLVQRQVPTMTRITTTNIVSVDLQVLRDENKRLTDENFRLTAEAKAFGAYREQFAASEINNAHLRTEIANLQAAFAASTAQHDVEKAHHKVEKAQHKVEKKYLDDQIQKLTDEIHQLKEQNKKLQAENELLQQYLDACKKTNKMLEERNNSMDARLNKLEQENKDAKQRSLLYEAVKMCECVLANIVFEKTRKIDKKPKIPWASEQFNITLTQILRSPHLEPDEEAAYYACMRPLEEKMSMKAYDIAAYFDLVKQERKSDAHSFTADELNAFTREKISELSADNAKVVAKAFSLITGDDAPFVKAQQLITPKYILPPFRSTT